MNKETMAALADEAERVAATLEDVGRNVVNQMVVPPFGSSVGEQLGMAAEECAALVERIRAYAGRVRKGDFTPDVVYRDVR